MKDDRVAMGVMVASDISVMVASGFDIVCVVVWDVIRFARLWV